MNSKIQIHEDIRGNLIPIDFKSIPFPPKRSFLVKNVPVGTIRGKHAHYTTEQLLICLYGNIKLSLDNGVNKKIKIMSKGDIEFHKKMEWAEIEFLSEQTELWVFCSTEFDEKDYIKNYKEFLKLCKGE